MKTYKLTTIGLLTAVLCILGPLSIVLPFSPIPLSLGTLGVMLSCVLLPPKSSLLCTSLYLLLGFVGLPVFAGFTGGVGKLLGPTGGYLIGYLLLAGIGSYFVNKWPHCFFMQIIGLFIGICFCSLIGSIWLMYQTKLHVAAALLTGILPYLVLDIGKIILSLLLGNNIKKRFYRLTSII